MPRILRTLTQLTVAAVLVTTFFGIVPANARNDAIATQPAPGSRQQQQPDAVTVVLDDPAKPPYSMVVKRPSGDVVANGRPHVVSTNMALQMATGLPDDVYTVEYRSQGQQGPEGGSFQFVIGDSGSVDYSGIRSWGGYDDVPPDLALEGDAAAEAAERARARASASASASPTTAVSTSAVPSGKASATDRVANAAGHDTDGSGLPWWSWLAAGVVALFAAGVAFLAVRRRRSSDGSPPNLN